MSLVCVSLQLKSMSLSRNSMCTLHCPGSCHAEHWHVSIFVLGDRYKIVSPDFQGFGFAIDRYLSFMLTLCGSFKSLSQKISISTDTWCADHFLMEVCYSCPWWKSEVVKILAVVFDQAVVMRTSKLHICSWDLACNEYLFLQVTEHKGMEIFLLWHVFVAYYW